MAPHAAEQLQFRSTWYELTRTGIQQRQGVIYADTEAHALDKARAILKTVGRDYSGLSVRLAETLSRG